MPKSDEEKERVAVDIQCEMSRSYIGLKEYEKAESLLLAARKRAEKCDICGVLEEMVNLMDRRFWQIRRDLCVRSVLGNAQNYMEAGNEGEAVHLYRYVRDCKGVSDKAGGV